MKPSGSLFSFEKRLEKVLLRAVTFLVFTSFLMFTSHQGLAQNKLVRVDSNKSMSLEEIFNLIKAQTDYKFVYNAQLIEHASKVNVSQGEMKAGDLLAKGLKQAGLDFEFANNTFVVKHEAAPAQQKQAEVRVTGKVVDEEGTPLPGVTVAIKGATIGTITDMDGNYAIKVPGSSSILVFSFIGMQTKEVQATSANVNVTLEKQVIGVDEVLVVAYGTQSKKAIVGSVSSIGADKLEKQNVTTITQALQGNSPGVLVVNAGGQPDNQPTIRIRGISSLGASAEPLIIVDGAQYGGYLTDISADQIESMNILKDAASTALYGSRGSNGVILITTKSGAFDQAATISVSASSGISTPAVSLHPLMTTEQLFKTYWEIYRNTRYYLSSPQPTWDEAGAAASANLIGELGYNPYSVRNPIDSEGNIVNGAYLLWNTDWAKEILRKTSLRHEYNMSVSGGSKKSKYYLAANYMKIDGSVRTSTFDRFTTRSSITTKVTDWLEAGYNSSLSLTKSVAPEQGSGSFYGSTSWVYNVASIYPLYRRDENGELVRNSKGEPIYDYGTNDGIVNASRPVMQGDNVVGALYTYQNTAKKTNVGINGYIDIKFTKWLSFRSTASYNNLMAENWGYGDPENGYAALYGGFVSESRNVTATINLVNALHFSKALGDHHLSGDAIHETYQNKIETLSASGKGYLPGIYVLDGATSPWGVGGSTSEMRMESYLGRLSYNYRDTYFFESSFRTDGSSQFSEDTRWGKFFSLGGSAILSNLDFLKNNTVLSFLKIKGSYGELGNNQGLGNFPYLQTFSTGYNEQDEPGVFVSSVHDPGLTWEKTASSNIGIDFGLFGDKVEGTIEYYNKKSIDLIMSKPIATSTGFGSVTKNVGSVKNYGLEFSLNAKLMTKRDFTWNAGLNFSFDRNEILKLTQDEIAQGTKRWRVGRSAYDFYLRDWAGVDPADGYGMWYANVLDANGDPTGERTTTKDYTKGGDYYVGSSLPKMLGGFNTTITWKGFDFNLMTSFSVGAKLYDGDYASLMSTNSYGHSLSPDLLRRWQQPGDVTDVPVFLYGSTANKFAYTSTRFLYDNDYLRVRAISLGYTLPKSVSDRLKLKKMRVYAQGDNLFTWQSHKGTDPEQGISGVTGLRSSILKTVSFGVNIDL